MTAQLPLPNSVRIMVTPTAICTEASPEWAQRVVDFLRERGWPAVLGDEADLPQSPEFTRDWNEACDKTWHR